MIVSAIVTLAREGRVDTGFGVTVGDIDVEVLLTAIVEQDSGAGFASELCVVWLNHSLNELERHGFTAEELDGAIEAIEVAYFVERQRTEAA